jgi:hypothetical protein
MKFNAAQHPTFFRIYSSLHEKFPRHSSKHGAAFPCLAHTPSLVGFIPYHGPIMQKDKINALHFSLLLLRRSSPSLLSNYLSKPTGLLIIEAATFVIVWTWTIATIKSIKLLSN